MPMSSPQMIRMFGFSGTWTFLSRTARRSRRCLPGELISHSTAALHPRRANHPAQTRMMQRKPRWHVDVSTGWPSARPAGSAGSSWGRRGGSPPSSPCAGSGAASAESWLRSRWAPRGISMAQQVMGGRLMALPNQSAVHSQTLPVMSTRPYPLGGKEPTGEVPVVPVRAGVVQRELALPGVGHQRPTGRELVAPGERRALEPAARGVLPLGLGRQLLAGPLRRRPRRPRRRRARPGWSGVRFTELPGPCGWRQLALGDLGPPVVGGPSAHGGAGCSNTTDAGTSSSGFGARVVGRVGRPLGGR